MRLIDADKLLEAIDNQDNWLGQMELAHMANINIYSLINSMPTVEAYTEDDVKNAIKEGHEVGYEMARAKFERPTGEWITLNGDKVCPFCRTGTSHNTNASISFFQFCPYCGADMRVKNELNELKEGRE